MEVVVLGGAGAMARPALDILAGRVGIESLVVADLRRDEAERVAAAYGPHVRAAGVDVASAPALAQLLGPADLVVNTSGPYFRLALPVLRAAIETRTHYIDICDDWEPIGAMLDLDAPARAVGVTALIGMGASPGLSNLLAKIAVGELDDTTDLVTAWPVDVDLSGAPPSRAGREEPETSTEDVSGAAVVHWMQQLSGEVCALRAGQLVPTRPLAPVELAYPGRRPGTAYLVGHPEPIMFARTFGLRGDSSNAMVVSSGTVAFLDGLRRAIDAGALTLEAAAHEVAHPNPRRVAGAWMKSLRTRGHGGLPGFFALASGTRDGKPARVGARLVAAPEGMAAITGIPLGLAASTLLDGHVRARGVVTPEQVLEPSDIFGRLAAWCAPPRAHWTDIVTVDRS